MPARLHIVVTGDTNCGKTSLVNALLHRPLLPTSFQSETSAVTYVIPKQLSEGSPSKLHLYDRGKEGTAPTLLAEGHENVHACLKKTNREARKGAGSDFVECCVTSALRPSLELMADVEDNKPGLLVLDVPGGNDELNPGAQVCANLAYALSDTLVICVKHDQVNSNATRRLVEQLIEKVPFFFDDALAFENASECPLVFAITQVDQLLVDATASPSRSPSRSALVAESVIEALRGNLRCLLGQILGVCPLLAEHVPILVISAKSATPPQGFAYTDALSQAVPKEAAVSPSTASGAASQASSQPVENVSEMTQSQAAMSCTEATLSEMPQSRRPKERAWLRRLALKVSCICARADEVAVAKPTAPAIVCEDVSSRVQFQAEWPSFEKHLLGIFVRREKLVRDCKIKRAAHARQAVEASLMPYLQGETWPFHAESLWGTRREKTLAVGACALAVAVDLATTGASVAAASSAAAAASSATAAANTMKAWLFGFGRYGAAAAAAQASAASAASRAVFFSAWSAADAVSAITATGLSHFGIGDIAGMRVAHASAVGARSANEAAKRFRFDALAGEIKTGATYRDVLYHPPGTVRAWNFQTLSSFPFQLQHGSSGRYLGCSGSEVACGRDVRSNQIWWAVPSFQEGTFMLLNAEAHSHLFAGASRFGLYVGAALAPSAASWSGASPTSPSTTAMTWRLAAGSRQGHIRLQNLAHGQYLQRGGVDIPNVGAAKEWLSCEAEQHPDQDWVVVPKPLLYLGEFKERVPSGWGQLFWPDGSPSFLGSICGGKLDRGFLFNPLGICLGRFRFDADGGAEPFGFQPEELDNVDVCITCRRKPNMASKGQVYTPCGHGLVCEACDWVSQQRECAFCGAAVEGLVAADEAAPTVAPI